MLSVLSVITFCKYPPPKARCNPPNALFGPGTRVLEIRNVAAPGCAMCTTQQRNLELVIPRTDLHIRSPLLHLRALGGLLAIFVVFLVLLNQRESGGPGSGQTANVVRTVSYPPRILPCPSLLIVSP